MALFSLIIKKKIEVNFLSECDSDDKLTTSAVRTHVKFKECKRRGPVFSG
jgi:hypothetical protein